MLDPDNHEWNLYNLYNYPCPCCGYYTFRKPPESYDICPICFWEDDSYQLCYPDQTGANTVTLIEGQKNFALFGASERHVRPYVRPVSELDRRDPMWRLIDLSIDDFEQVFDLDVSLENLTLEQYSTLYEAKYGPRAKLPDDNTRLYYWRENYWRRQKIE